MVEYGRKGVDSMKKVCLFLLAALLLCGLFACKPVIPAKEAEASPAPSESAASSDPVQTAAPDQTESPIFSEENARPVTFTEDADTRWYHRFNLYLYTDDTGLIDTPSGVLWFKGQDGEFSLEMRLYRTADDDEPTCVFPAGKIRLQTDGKAIRVEVLSDPFGILAYDEVDGCVLKKMEGKPYSSRYLGGASTPRQPDCEWRERNSIFRTDESLVMTGTVAEKTGARHSCTMLSSGRAYAFVEETDGETKLLLYATRKPVDYREKLVRINLTPIYDPYDICYNSSMDLYRTDLWEEGYNATLRLMLGRQIDTVRISLIQDGWTDHSNDSDLPKIPGCFAWLSKDGQTLLIHYDYDYSFFEEPYADAFVLYDSEGKVLEWSGFRPVDHTLAEAYTHELGGDYFDPGPDYVDADEDDFVYFLDNGYVAIEDIGHEGIGGDFRIVRVIP